VDEKLKISGKRCMESCSKKDSFIIDWMKRNISLESNNYGIITLKVGHEISYNGRISGWLYTQDRRQFHYATSMEMCQINVLQAASELGVIRIDCRAWIQSQII
jgi:hypothetical protein